MLARSCYYRRMPRTMDREARKAQLAEAVWQVILQCGVSAVSVRTVADQAGVAVGSLRHVFPTRAELVVFSAELTVQRATKRVLATPPSEDPREYALSIIKSLLPLDADRRAEMEVNLALFAEHAALPEIARIRDHAHHQIAKASVRMIEMLTGTSETPEAVAQARRLHAIIDGLALHLLHQPPEGDGEWAVDVVQRDLDDLVTSTRPAHRQ